MISSDCICIQTLLFEINNCNFRQPKCFRQVFLDLFKSFLRQSYCLISLIFSICYHIEAAISHFSDIHGNTFNPKSLFIPCSVAGSYWTYILQYHATLPALLHTSFGFPDPTKSLPDGRSAFPAAPRTVVWLPAGSFLPVHSALPWCIFHQAGC